MGLLSSFFFSLDGSVNSNLIATQDVYNAMINNKAVSQWDNYHFDGKMGCNEMPSIYIFFTTKQIIQLKIIGMI